MDKDYTVSKSAEAVSSSIQRHELELRCLAIGTSTRVELSESGAVDLHHSEVSATRRNFGSKDPVLRELSEAKKRLFRLAATYRDNILNPGNKASP
jgi:hypothetical protein